MPDSTVIVPVFNQALLTSQCLETILERDRCRVIVVDDGSTDDTPSLLARYGSRIQVLTHSTNQGFATSCNHGADLVQSENLIFLNNDTIAQPGWIEALEEYAAAHPRAAAVGSRLLYPDQTIQHAGVVVCQDRYPRHIYSGFAASHSAVISSRRFQIVTAACMLVRCDVFRKAGGFDTGFRNGFEDVDFCLRLGEDGHEVHYCAESVLVHLESVSPGRSRHNRENVALYRERWMHRVEPDDVRYYVEDGLLRFSYEGRYPISLEVSPLLATQNAPERNAEVEQVIRKRSREVAELSRENTQLRLELGARFKDSPQLRYQQLRLRIRATARRLIPTNADVLVVSRGDGALLELGYHGWHFPRTRNGAYAGFHPSSSTEAIAHLEELRMQGARYLLIPETSAWWLEHYAEFRQHLDSSYRRLSAQNEGCHIFELTEPKAYSRRK